MTWGMTAVAGATLVGGYMSSQAAGKAASAQENAANQANATQTAQFNKQVELNAPFREAGLSAQNQLLTYLGLPSTAEYMPKAADFNEQAYLDANPDIAGRVANGEFGAYQHYQDYGQYEGRDFAYNDQGLARKKAAETGDVNNPNFGLANKPFTYSDMYADPGYAFRLDQGNKALNASAAARGGLISGNALKAAQDYGQAAGSQEYTNAFNRYQTQRSNLLNPLQSLLGVGQTATGATTNASANYANQYGANTIGAGNAQASGYVGSANAWNQALGQGVNAYQTNQLINRFAPRTAGGSSLGNLATTDANSYGAGWGPTGYTGTNG